MPGETEVQPDPTEEVEAAGEGETTPESPAGEEESTPRSESATEEVEAEEPATGDDTPDAEETAEGGEKPTPKGNIPHARAEAMARRRVEKAIAVERARFRAFLEANREHFDPSSAQKRVRDELVDTLIKALKPELKEKPKEFYTTAQVDKLLEEKLSEITSAQEKERELTLASHQLEGLKSKYPDVFQAFPALPRMLAREWGSQDAFRAGYSMSDVGEAIIADLLKGSDLYAKGAGARREKKREEAEVLRQPKGTAAPKPTGKKKGEFETIEDVEAAVDRLLG